MISIPPQLTMPEISQEAFQSGLSYSDDTMDDDYMWDGFSYRGRSTNVAILAGGSQSGAAPKANLMLVKNRRSMVNRNRPNQVSSDREPIAWAALPALIEIIRRSGVPLGGGPVGTPIGPKMTLIWSLRKPPLSKTSFDKP